MTKEKPYDSSDPKQVNKAKQKAYSLQEKLSNGIAKICNDPECRFVLQTFFEEAKIFHSNFNPNPTEHAFNEGYRSSGLWWLSLALLHDPSIVSKIQHDKDLNQQAGTQDDRYTSDTDSDTSSE